MVKNMGKGFGTTALIFGSFCIPVSVAMAAFGSILSVGSIWGASSEITSLFSVISWFIPGIASIFGLVGIVVDDSKGRAIAGFVLGLIGLMIAIIVPLVFENLFTSIIP